MGLSKIAEPLQTLGIPDYRLRPGDNVDATLITFSQLQNVGLKDFN